MARETLAKVMPLVFKSEGGYVDHPKDPGSATNMGITIGTLSHWLGRPATKDEVRAITKDQATAIYRANYWNAIRGDDLPAGLDYAVFDFAINSGPSRAAKYLQDLLDVRIDGFIGPETIAAARSRNIPLLINRLCDDRLDYVKRLPTWPTFGKGWSSRIAKVRSEALKLVGASVAHPPIPDASVPPKPTTAPPRGFFHALGKLLEALLSAFKRKDTK